MQVGSSVTATGGKRSSASNLEKNGPLCLHQQWVHARLKCQRLENEPWRRRRGRGTEGGMKEWVSLTWQATTWRGVVMERLRCRGHWR